MIEKKELIEEIKNQIELLKEEIKSKELILNNLIENLDDANETIAEENYE